jgi:hypothetical protein
MHEDARVALISIKNATTGNPTRHHGSLARLTESPRIIKFGCGERDIARKETDEGSRGLTRID